MMTKKELSIGLALLMTTGLGHTYAQTKKVDFTGAGRTWISNSQLDVRTETADTVTAPKASDGSTALDFGINLAPNENTEIHGVFRLTHQFGGFWGGGIEFSNRELWVKGVALDKIRYQIGDINLSMTPFTMYNFGEDLAVNEADIFEEMRKVMRYENFYDGNTWRQQGATAEFGWQFDKGIEKLDVKPFMTRWRAQDGGFANRFLGGGTISIIQSENMRFGVNNVINFDAADINGDTIGLMNPVYTLDFEYLHKSASYVGGVSGEIGGSQYKYAGAEGDTNYVDLADIFYEVGVFYSHNASGVSAQLRYREVGPDFRSGAAQSRRLDWSGDNTLFTEYTNSYMERPLLMMDLMSNATLYAPTFGYDLSSYNPFLNMTLPFGDATPNRRGVLLDVLYADKNNLVNADVDFGMLSEVIGSGTTDTKSFMLIKAGVDVDIAQLAGIEDRVLKLTGEAKMESSSRAGTDIYEAVDLSTMMIGAGLQVELVDNLDLLGGFKMLSGSGTDYMAVRDADNVVFDYVQWPWDKQTLTLMAGGLRYRFGERTALNAFYQTESYANTTENYDGDFAIGQFSVLFFTRF